VLFLWKTEDIHNRLELFLVNISSSLDFWESFTNMPWYRHRNLEQKRCPVPHTWTSPRWVSHRTVQRRWSRLGHIANCPKPPVQMRWASRIPVEWSCSDFPTLSEYDPLDLGIVNRFPSRRELRPPALLNEHHKFLSKPGWRSWERSATDSESSLLSYRRIRFDNWWHFVLWLTKRSIEDQKPLSCVHRGGLFSICCQLSDHVTTIRSSAILIK
jgi:hypothetical protein